MHPPLRSMPPLAAAATECRLSTGRSIALELSGRKKTDPSATGQPCSVRLHGDVVVSYCLSEVGGHRTRLVREDPPRRYDKLFYLYDHDAFFGSRSSCRDIIHQMLAQTPVVGDLDLAAGNWDEGHFLPHDVATMIHGRSWLPDLLYSEVDVCVDVLVSAVYSEPRALLLACKQVTAAHCRFTAGRGADAAGASECCVCMEDMSAREVDGPDAVMLPCSHAFHVRCLLPWFDRRSTCPMCRQDMMIYLVAVAQTPKGRFPGLEA